MTKQEEILKLRQFPQHYLWNKKRSLWTSKDIENLANASENSEKCIGKPRRVQPVIQHKDGEITKFDSCIDASRITGIKVQGIYAAVNGHAKKAGGYMWEKAVQ